MTAVRISEPLVDRLLKDSGFLAQFPQFTALARMKPPEQKTGCRGCAKRKQSFMKTRSFLKILGSSGQAGLDRVKKHIGADTLQYQSFNSTTQKWELKSV